MTSPINAPSAALTRRHLIQASSAVTAVALASGDLRFTSAQTPVTAASREAPSLAEQVSAGNLPPLEERLPKNPMVLQPLEEIGQYGGRIRRGLNSPQDSNNFLPLVRASLLEWSLDNQYQVVPGLAESWEVNADATVYTFRLREGIRWSDGQPLTTDDYMFYYTDILGNTELSPAFPTWLVTEGENAVFHQIDELTLEIQFAYPQGLLPRFLCFAGWQMNAPKHCLQQFHPAHVDQATIDAAIEEAGTEDWVDMFTTKQSAFSNPDLPVLGAWVMTEPISGGATRAIATRNPYYWKVDPEGNQLPYIDELVFDVLEQTAIVLRAANGEIDLQNRHFSFRDVPVLQEAATESGAFNIYQWKPDAPWPAMYMNQSHKDPVMRELMQNIDFRAGLSHAINREEMNEIMFLGLGGIQHPCAIPDDPYYVDGYGYRFTEYDVDEANARLDAAGLTERDGDGFRLRPDGEPLQLTILTHEFENGADTYELVKQYWDAVGVRTAIELVDRVLWGERVQANEVDVAGYLVAGFLWDIDPLWYVPVSQATYWAPGFGTWYATNGANGEEPSEISIQLQNLYEQMVAAPDDETRISNGQEILAIHDENVFMIGAVMSPFNATVVNSNLGNVFKETVASYRTHNEGGTGFEQVFYRST